MNHNADNLVRALNTLDNTGRDIVRSLDEIQQSHEKLRADLQAMLAHFGDVRLAVEQAAYNAQTVEEEFFRVLDQCFAMPEQDCPAGVRDLLKSSMEHIGYMVYGFPGEAITDMAAVEIVAREEQRGIGEQWFVTRCLRVGLRRSDGTIVRRPRVVVSRQPRCE